MGARETTKEKCVEFWKLEVLSSRGGEELTQMKKSGHSEKY